MQLELFRTSSLHNAMLFKLSRRANIFRLSQWNSSMAFFAYLSALHLSSCMTKNAQSETVDITSLRTVSTHLKDRTDSDSILIIALAILRCLSALSAYTSFQAVVALSSRSFNLTLHLDTCYCLSNDLLLDYVQRRCLQTLLSTGKHVHTTKLRDTSWSWEAELREKENCLLRIC